MFPLMFGDIYKYLLMSLPSMFPGLSEVHAPDNKVSQLLLLPPSPTYLLPPLYGLPCPDNTSQLILPHPVFENAHSRLPSLSVTDCILK